MYVNVFMFQ